MSNMSVPSDQSGLRLIQFRLRDGDATPNLFHNANDHIQPFDNLAKHDALVVEFWELPHEDHEPVRFLMYVPWLHMERIPGPVRFLIGLKLESFGLK